MSDLHPPKVHLWFPEIYGFKGGIQVYSAFLLSALQQVCPQARLDVFLKHDTSPLVAQHDDVRHSDTHFHTAGAWPRQLRTVAFAAQLITQGLIQRPNLIIAAHVHFTPVAHLLWRIARIPYWTIVYGIEAWTIRSPQERRAVAAAANILAISGYTRDRLAQHLGLQPSSVALLPNTFDATRFQIGPRPPALLHRYHLRADQPVILTVARLAKTERYKGYEQILRALPLIRAHIPDVHYVVVGKGDDRPRLEQLITELGVQHNVTLAGYVPDAELADHYNLCDIFAMPSKKEGFGMVYLEALACGKPTLGGNQDGALDALCHGALGVLVDPDDVAQIAATITAILQRRHPHPLLYQPDALRAAVLAQYGFPAFTARLGQHLTAQFPTRPPRQDHA